MFHQVAPYLSSISELNMSVSLIVSAVLGAALGVERSIAGKHAGMRTYALVSLGSCLFVAISTIASYAFVTQFAGVNPLQLAGSIIIGVGFIGSGLAVLRGGDQHAELTTATGIWVVAGIGMACGFGLYLLALVSTILAALILSFFLRLENSVRKTYGTKTE